jgi:Spy/CpxP family protein refolding chaperone
METNSSLLLFGTVAFVDPALSFTIILTVVPYAVEKMQELPSIPNSFQLLLSMDQQKGLQNLQLVMKPQIMKILNPIQQIQLDESLKQGQALWQGLTLLDLSETQRTKIKRIMKNQRLKIFKLLTPSQRQQFGRSLPAQLFQ